MKKIKLLCADADRQALEPVLEQLRARGLKLSEDTEKLRGHDIVLTALSKNLYADGAAVEKLLTLLDAGAEKLLLLQLDDAPMPELLKSALFARSSIFTRGRDAAYIAERIHASLPQKKRRLPRIFIAASAVLLAVLGVFLYRSVRSRQAASLPTEAQIAAAAELGLTAEDLAQIRCVVIVGEHFVSYTDRLAVSGTEDKSWPDMIHELAGEETHAQSRDWYWHEDGSQASMTAYDLRFLSLMPNLEEIHICLADITHTPDLSALKKLNTVWLYDCRVDDLEWLADSPVEKVQIECEGVDFSPLGRSRTLSSAILILHSAKSADLSAFSPPQLQDVDINCAFSADGYEGLDLSGLARCKRLKKIHLNGVALRDLSVLEGKTSVTDLNLEDMGELRDVSALGTLSRLQHLLICDCDAITDLSPISRCTALQSFFLSAHGDNILRDASFLAALPALDDLNLENVDLPNLDFLAELASRHKEIKFCFYGKVRDYSALASCGAFRYLHLDPVCTARPEDVLPYLQGVRIGSLDLCNFNRLDLAALPEPSEQLRLDRCDLVDLSSLPEGWSTPNLQLDRCAALRSLEGLQKLERLGRGGVLEVLNCPLLSDWSALEGMELDRLEIKGGYTLPSFDAFYARELCLESVDGVTDLGFLDGADAARPRSFTLVGLDGLQNLRPLSRFHGSVLTVSPQLREQAEDLAADGNFDEVRIQYPEGSWLMDNQEIELLSIDELQTLPAALLRRVKRLRLVGDTLVTDEVDILADWQDGGDAPSIVLRDRSTGEERLLERGAGGVTDLKLFRELSGLKELELYEQPIERLDGVQSLPALERFAASCCPALADASALFSVQSLTQVRLNDSAVTSLQGVQNLYELRQLDISHTKITDLTPLLELEELEELVVSADMEAAIASLEGRAYAFSLKIV